MLLRELSVQNFRPFERATMRLPASGLTLVAGANNTGKSALLSGLDVVAGMDPGVQNLRRAGSVHPARITATFELDLEERRGLFTDDLPGSKFVPHGAASRLQFVFEEQPGGNLVLAHVLGEWPGRGLQIFVTTGPAQNSGYRVKIIRGLFPGYDDIDPRVLIDQGSTFSGPIPTPET
jgi:hypothetical protein